MCAERDGQIAELTNALHRLEAEFAATDVKKEEELKQMTKENSELMADLTDRVQKQEADTVKLNEFAQKQGEYFS